jgi:predicted SnoaL-like aldol condensation-catalyzing enzyme
MGCSIFGGTSNHHPEGALAAYAKAVQGKNYAEAYELMSDNFRQKYPKEDFIRMLKDNAADVRFYTAKFKDKPQKRKVRAVLEYANGDNLFLVMEGEEWKLAAEPLSTYSQQTPSDALRSFIRAVEQRRYHIVLRFVPSRWASSMSAAKLQQEWEGSKKKEVGLLIQNLRANRNAKIHMGTNTATMPYGGKYQVRFIREEGKWKIEDPD